MTCEHVVSDEGTGYCQVAEAYAQENLRLRVVVSGLRSIIADHDNENCIDALINLDADQEVTDGE